MHSIAVYDEFVNQRSKCVRLLWRRNSGMLTSGRASSSHGSSLELTRSVELGKHIVHTHFLEDRNCEICQRTKIARVPCTRRNGEAVPRAANFCDLITADHKVLSEGCESRNKHRHAVVVQDLATQWILAYPCKNKTSQETQRSLQKFLEPERKPEVIYTDKSLEFGKACEDLSWNHCTSTPHRSETNGIAERAVRREKEGTSAVLLQSGLNESWKGQILWNVTPICETSQICYLMGRRPMKDVLGNHLKDRLHHLVPLFYCEGPVKNPSIWKENITWIVPWMRSVRVVNLEG